jgi:hypothetical protein
MATSPQARLSERAATCLPATRASATADPGLIASGRASGAEIEAIAALAGGGFFVARAVSGGAKGTRGRGNRDV